MATTNKTSANTTPSTTTTKTTSESTSTTATTKRKSVGFGYLMSLVAYAAVVICGLALFIAMVLSKFGISATFTTAMQTIANALGWLVLCVISFNYIRRRRTIWMWVVWAVAIVMIVTGMVFII